MWSLNLILFVVDVEKRKDMFLSAFSARSGYATPSSQTPLSVLVKRLQESLTRMESFDVVTTSPGSMDGSYYINFKSITL